MAQIINELVQIYLPVTDIRRSVEWYKDVFDYELIWEEHDYAHLKLMQGPMLFLKKTLTQQPVKFSLNDQESAVLSFKTSDIDELHSTLKYKKYDVGEIVVYGMGTNGPYREFGIRDPDGHIIEINSYPDIALPRFRGY
jgi:catechol 2,3-dioxygenase-like lactoylglutathione lyase family enzyme